ncbi:site-specific integrase [Paenibacillus filicis]|uniref:Site-specific integrase n=1 Tax=Paenibacillus gyeongsangnamensis TaxID=3388067 RepID=A0ABT4QAI5_9BACL|nr:site-specific integrase [Paenibacillus filicis]MCZ8513893.1 site-specific integrase [Paenibacillus filicis]
MKEYYLYKIEERVKMGDRFQGGEYDFIFCHPDGKAFHQERPYLWFRDFIKKNNLRYIRFHDLRHTSATLLINQGVHAKIISQRLGHSNINTTMNIYGHALRSADQSAGCCYFYHFGKMFKKLSGLLLIDEVREVEILWLALSIIFPYPLGNRPLTG